MRVRVVVLLVLITGSLAWVGTQALSGNLLYYVTPTELLQRTQPPTNACGSADRSCRDRCTTWPTASISS